MFFQVIFAYIENKTCVRSLLQTLLSYNLADDLGASEITQSACQSHMKCENQGLYCLQNYS